MRVNNLPVANLGADDYDQGHYILDYACPSHKPHTRRIGTWGSSYNEAMSDLTGDQANEWG